MKMITKNFLLILLLLFLQTSLAINQTMNSHICSPSACGIIPNISFPFRLKHDPIYCGYSDYELSCENNVTLVYVNSQKYQVKAINYHDFTMRVVDVSINNYICSFPTNFSYTDDLSDFFYRDAVPINLMSCPYPLKNSTFLEVTNDCADVYKVTDASNITTTRNAYIKVGNMDASEVEDMCSIDMIARTSWKFHDLKNVSLSEIHKSLLYGIELDWQIYTCSKCKKRSSCSTDYSLGQRQTTCDGDIEDHYAGLLLLLLIIVFFAGVSLPVMIIAVFTCAWVLYMDRSETGEMIRDPLFLMISGTSFFAKNMILFPCMIGFLIYKFRRRYLSMYDAIEEYLPSDNKLMPIRYSYSDIKKMTRGFQEKLGQGGYGTVYKGKLRSGYDVAVKQLKKPGGNDQDFMNEIATIGRIHHVNVINLVGYCAERSKRALVFDFMSNGSLDKYIVGREKINCLSWERKYEIAVGVARGIEYLHKGCDIQILHFDIKPHNILLDDNFTPKISDFGLAKFYSTDKKMVTMTTARGTIGYVAPELINRGFGGVSHKADVYSFGMLVMEMIGLNRNLKGNTQASNYFPCWIYDCFEQGQDIEIGATDENNDDDICDMNKKVSKKMTIVALWCIQMSPDDRPSMNKVVEMLEGPVERLQVPNRPFQSPQVAVSIEDESWGAYTTDSTSLLRDAALEITVED